MSNRVQTPIIPVAKGGMWSCECLPRVAVCAVDGHAVATTLLIERWTEAPPDVLAVQQWYDEHCAAAPLTVESLAVAPAARRRLPGCVAFSALATGVSESHGRITYRVA